MDRSEERKVLHVQRLISLPLVNLKVWLHMCKCVCVCVPVYTDRNLGAQVLH